MKAGGLEALALIMDHPAKTYVFGVQLWDPARWSGIVPDLILNPPEGQYHCEGTFTVGNIIIKA